MSKNLWEVIREAKGDQNYVSSEQQYENLKRVLSSLTTEEIQSIRSEWWDVEKKMFENPEYDKFHVNDGGFIRSDDTFDMDFPAWIVAQGEELYNQFMTIGHQAIIDYMEKNNVNERECTYECMGYVFQEFLKEQKYFVSYAACTEASTRPIILNDFITTDEPITRKLIQDIEISLIDRLNKEFTDLEYKYNAAQIINFIKIS